MRLLAYLTVLAAFVAVGATDSWRVAAVLFVGVAMGYALGYADTRRAVRREA